MRGAALAPRDLLPASLPTVRSEAPACPAAARTGRFVSENPIGLEGGINPVVFASNNPISGRDPSGLCDLWADYTMNADGTANIIRTYCKDNMGSGVGGGGRSTTPPTEAPSCSAARAYFGLTMASDILTLAGRIRS